MTMRLSILIPVYNAACYLSETLDSLLNQDFQDYEILCIDDGSTDDSPRILSAYSRSHPQLRVLTQKNSGVSAARNRGIREATGDYIWFVDADDLIPPHIFKTLVAQAQGYERLAFDAYSFHGKAPSPEENPENLPCNTPWYDSVVWRNLISREFLLGHGLFFREDLSHGEDGFFLYELAQAQPRFRKIDLCAYYYRLHPQSAENLQTPELRQKRLCSHLRATELYKARYDAGETAAANKLLSYLWMSLYEIAALPAPETTVFLRRCKESNLFPMRRPREASLRRSFLVEPTSLPRKCLEFLCCHLHRPWGFYTLRLLRRLMKK